MVYRDRFQGLQSAVHAAPTDGAVVGARSTRPLWASPKCFQNLAGVGGGGVRAVPKPDRRVIGFGVPGMMLWLRTACCIARNNNKTQVIRAAAAHGDGFATVTKSPR
jgi:hypothetical protein